MKRRGSEGPRGPLRRRMLGAGALAAVLPVATGCKRSEHRTLRYGAQVFPAYELIYLARHLQQFSEDDVRLIESPSATSNLRALASGAMEGASMTLDEVLVARERGLNLSVVAVLDASVGADVLMAMPGVGGLRALQGRHIGVEPTAVGAVMLDAALGAGGLTLADVKIRHLPLGEHETELRAGRVDGVVTYEPARSRLLDSGAQVLFDSRRIPGRILDVIAMRSECLASDPQAILRLVAGHFHARDAWTRAPHLHAAELAPRLGMAPDKVASAFDGLQLIDREQNQRWFAQDAAHLKERTRELATVMLHAGLLQSQPRLELLFDGRFV